MSEFLRLDFVRDEKKIALAVGDIYSINGNLVTCDKLAANTINEIHLDNDNQRFIKSFAPRKNEGVQPVGDDVIVTVAFKSGELWVTEAEGAHWGSHGNDDDIVTYTPNYDALLKMQNEFDEKESEVITDKEMKIVEAVNYFQSILLRHLDKTNIYYNESTKFTVGSHGQFVCTIAEFNQCIEEMAAAEWLNGYRRDYVRYKADCFAEGIDTSNKRLQKEVQPTYTKAMRDAGEMPRVGMVCDIRLNATFHGKSIITYISDYNVCFMHNGVESSVNTNIATFECTETRTPEEIEAEELEAAKKEQREDVAESLNDMFGHNTSTWKDFIDEAKTLQDEGRLAKIILPLK